MMGFRCSFGANMLEAMYTMHYFKPFYGNKQGFQDTLPPYIHLGQQPHRLLISWLQDRRQRPSPAWVTTTGGGSTHRYPHILYQLVGFIHRNHHFRAFWLQFGCN